MSDAIPEDKAGDGGGSWVRRLNRTPWRDLVRGRVTGRLDLDAKLAAADLPPDVAALVRHVVKRTRLSRLERADVTDELIAHFRDGHDAGAGYDGLLDSFGDPATAARLIRRAKRRNRSWAWKSLVWARRAFGVLVLVYALVAVRFFWGHPEPSVDYVAAINTPARAVPADERAWPIYREAWIDWGFVELEIEPILNEAYDPVEPSDPEWDAAGAWLDEHRDLIETFRQGAAKPGLGFITAFGWDYDERDVLALYGPDHEQPPEPDRASSGRVKWLVEHSVIGVLLENLGPMRKMARIVAADLDHAAEAGEAERVLADLAALRGFAWQAAEAPLLINGLVGISIVSMHHERVDSLLTDYPDLLSDGQLRTLAHGIAALSPRDLLHFDGERAFMYDTIQRIYTDDGDGDGRMTDEGLRVMQMLGGPDVKFAYEATERPLALRAVESAAMPASLAVVASRREMRERYDAMMDEMEAEFAQPMRESDYLAAEGDIESWSLRERARFPLLATLVPAMGAVGRTAEKIEGKQDGVLLGIALELYRREHGNWPASLDALTPRFIPALPVDRITGGPLHYRVRAAGADEASGGGAGGPVVYSLGGDRDDDGGVAPVDPYDGRPEPRLAVYWDDQPNAQRDGDWVLFPQSVD